MSEEFLRRLQPARLLPDYILSGIYLQADHIFELLTKLVEMEYGDLGNGSLPFACIWGGMPDSPQNLQSAG
ncbi:MAG: hypothetical protein V4671_09460 [Armatimonadota bacterium]